MKKIIIYLISGVIILFLAFLVLFDFNKAQDSKSTNLEKVTLADTTLTPKTYMG